MNAAPENPTVKKLITLSEIYTEFAGHPHVADPHTEDPNAPGELQWIPAGWHKPQISDLSPQHVGAYFPIAPDDQPTVDLPTKAGNKIVGIYYRGKVSFLSITTRSGLTFRAHAEHPIATLTTNGGSQFNDIQMKDVEVGSVILLRLS